MSDVDRAELRRLLEEAELPWTIEHATPKMDGPNWQIRREGKAGIVVSAHEYGFHGRGEVIVAAINALPSLLDKLAKLEARLAYIGAGHKACHEQRDAAWAAIERVRQLHTPGDLWCEECGASWPCPTIQALGRGEHEALAGQALAAVLPDLLAQAWDEGRQLGLKQADYEFGTALSMPDLTNPYREENGRG